VDIGETFAITRFVRVFSPCVCTLH